MSRAQASEITTAESPSVPRIGPVAIYLSAIAAGVALRVVLSVIAPLN